MKFLITCGLILSSISLLGQSYRPFFLDNATWRIRSIYSQSAMHDSQIILNGDDTIINSKTYKSLYWRSHQFYNSNDSWEGLVADGPDSFFGGLREESKRIYIYSPTPDSERLVYDFNLGVGDTVPYCQFGQVWTTGVISNLQSITLANQTFIAQIVNDGNGEQRNVEGIGNLESGLEPFRPFQKLLCFSHFDTAFYITPGFTCGLIAPFGTPVEFLNQRDISIFPSITSDNILISHTSPNGLVAITDIRGKQVYFKSTVKPDLIDVSNLEDGIYLLNYRDRASSSSFKFVKH